MRRRELAAHLQRAEGAMVGSYLDASPAVAAAAGAATRRVDGVVCLAARRVDVAFLNRALGVGTIADATPRLLERIERHYAAIGRPSRVAIATGCVTLATLRLLERRGYVPERGAGQLIYRYDRRLPPEPPAIAGLRIERVGPPLATLYARTAHESFRDRGPEFAGIVEALVRGRRRGLRTYLGRVDGRPAATGMLMSVGPVGGLMNGSVRPAFRGRGIQKAMIVHRIREGWALGRRLFFGETENPASAHNLEDLGWRLAFAEITWERAVRSSGSAR